MKNSFYSIGKNFLAKTLLLMFSILSTGVFSANYYVHPTLGKDSNDGLSKEKPWASLWKAKQQKLKAGDSLLLAQGQVFHGSLSYKNLKGSEDNPITISSYTTDENAKPKRAHINSAGHLYGIHLLDSRNVNVSNISITANGGGIPDWIKEQQKKKWNKLKTPMRIGVYVEGKAKKTFRNIHLNNLFIKDIYYNKPGVSRSKAEVKSANGTQSYGWGIRFMTSGKSKLKNISVTNTTVIDVAHTGIKFTGSLDEVNVHHNIVYKAGGPGIQMSGVTNAHISYNKVDSSGNSDDSRKWGRGSGMWTWSSSDILVEYNQFTNASGPGDSAGFHIDYNCSHVVVQYNLSAHNAGGFCEILGNNYNNAYRYNISINDGYRSKGENNAFQEGKLFWLSGFQGGKKKRSGPFNSYFYNNTMYVSDEITTKIAIDRMTKGALIANNIFHIVGDSKQVMGDQYNPAKKGKAMFKNINFNNNLFLKDSNWPKDIKIQDSAPLYGDANFVNGGGVKLSDYTPQNIALVKDKGVEIKPIAEDDIGLKIGLKVTHDILGNKIVGKPDIGAIEITTSK